MARTRIRVASALRAGLWLASALLAPLAAQAQSLQLGTINVPVNVPSVPATPVTINVPTNVLGNIVNVPVNVVAGTVTNTLNVLPTTVNVPINILGNTVNVTVNVPTTTVTVTSSVLSGPVTISVPVGVDAPISINLPVGGGLVGTINAVDAIVAVRRNDALLGLDLGSTARSIS